MVILLHQYGAIMDTQLADDLLSGADAAAAFTGLSRRVIYHLVEAGTLPVIRIGRKLYFRRSELERVFRGSDRHTGA